MNISLFSSVKMSASDNYQSEGREMLLKLLPNNYNYHIYGVSDSRFGFNVHNEEELQNLFEDFSGTYWNKEAQMDMNQKKIKISGIRKCIYNVENKKRKKKSTNNQTTENVENLAKTQSVQRI